jgi:hypothetical protein
LDRELSEQIKAAYFEMVDEFLDLPATHTRTIEQIKKAYEETINSPDLYRDITLQLKRENEKIKQHVLESTKDTWAELEKVVCVPHLHSTSNFQISGLPPNSTRLPLSGHSL